MREAIATGVDNSAYEDFAQRYKTILARHHIKVIVRPSEGSMQNLHGLTQGGMDADIAFIQSGTSNDETAESNGLVSLGSLFVEPVWIFYRQAALSKVKSVPADDANPAKSHKTIAPQITAMTQLGEMRGLSLNVGPKGSGGPRLARQLLAANRVETDELTLSHLEDTPAVMKLLDGSLDAVMFVSAPETQLVQMLLQTPGIKLFNFDQAEAYSRRFPFLSHVVLPRGIVALERDIPHEDIHLIAPTATLVTKASTHPAIIELLMQAATEVHGGPGWFRRAGEFPNDQYTEIPVSPVAERYYKSGKPFLERYLPFWLANVIDRMWVIIVPVLALLIPLSRILPPLYTWRVRSRVYRWYGQLREVENDVDAASAANVAADAGKPPSRTDDDAPPSRDAIAKHRAKQLARLADIEAKVNNLVVPLSYANELYTLKLHIDRVRAKVVGDASFNPASIAPPSTPSEALAPAA